MPASSTRKPTSPPSPTRVATKPMSLVSQTTPTRPPPSKLTLNLRGRPKRSRLFARTICSAFAYGRVSRSSAASMPASGDAVMLRTLSAPDPRAESPTSARRVSSSTTDRGSISRIWMLPRVVTSPYPPPRSSARRASARICVLDRTLPGIRTRTMNASWAGATQNSPWNLKRNTSAPCGPRFSRACARTMSHMSYGSRSRLICSSREISSTGQPCQSSGPARFGVPDAALAVSLPAGSTPTNGITFAAAIPAANPCRYSFCSGVKDAEGSVAFIGACPAVRKPPRRGSPSARSPWAPACGR